MEYISQIKFVTDTCIRANKLIEFIIEREEEHFDS